MTTKRQWVLLTALGAVIILVAGFMLLVKPQHAKANDLRTQVSTAQSQTQSLQAQLAQLRSKEKSLPAEEAKLAGVVRKLPAGAQLPTLTRDLDAAAIRAHVNLTNISPSAPTAFTAATVAPVVPKAGVTPAPSASSTPATTAGSAAAGAASSNLQQVTLALTVTGGFYNLERFLDQLESLPRALLVDGFTVSTGGGAGNSSAPPGSGAASSTSTGELSITINARVFLTTTPLVSPSATSAK